MIVGQFGERLVEPHDVAGQLQAARAQRGLQQAEGRVALRLGHLLEADALAHVEVLVHPFAPFRIVDRETWSGRAAAGVRLARKRSAAVRTGAVETPVE